MRIWAPQFVVLGVFVSVSTAYNLRVPLSEAPDEIAQSRYVTSIAGEGKLPRFRTADEYESWRRL